MRRRLLWIMLLLLCTALPARAEYWKEAERPGLVCEVNNPACQVLQMVMLGSFDFFDSGDRLSVRVLSAALEPLCAVTESDLEHFIASFEEEEAVVRRFYYIALGNCLWANILSDGDAYTNEEQVLLLFLNTQRQGDEDAQLETIRKQMSVGMIEHLAQTMSVPEDFIHYLVFAEHWHAPNAALPE